MVETLNQVLSGYYSQQMIWVLKKIRQLLPKDGFVHSVTLLIGSTAFAQLITVAVSPLLTRLYQPADFGLLATYAALLAIVTVVASLRYELALPVVEDERLLKPLIGLCLFLILVTTTLLTLYLVMFGAASFTKLSVPQLIPYLWLFPLGNVAVGLYQLFTYTALRHKSYGSLARTKILQSISQLVVQIGLGILSITPLGLLLGQLLGQSTGTFMLARLTYQKQQREVKGLNITTILYVAKRYRRFPLLSSISGLLNTAGLQLPMLLLAIFYGPQVAGWFALTERILRMPLTLVGQSTAQVYLAEASQLAREEPQRLAKLFYQTSRHLLILGSCAILPLLFFAPWLFKVFFGESWLEAGRYAQILSLALLARFVVTPLSQTLNVLERQGLQFTWDAVRMVLVIASLWLPDRLDWTAQQAILIYGVGTFASYAVLFAIVSFSLTHYHRNTVVR